MSFDCTAAEEKILPRLFIEASAGTGKTYVIEQYVVRAVLDASLEGEDLDPKTFALVTFTRAVARELRLRVLKALKSAREYFLDENVLQNAPEYFSLYQDKRKAARALSRFIEGFHSATIATVHGFCERLLTLWQDETGEEEETWETSPRTWLQEFLTEQALITLDEWRLLGRHDLYDHNYFLDQILNLMQDPCITDSLSRKEQIEFLKSAVNNVRVEFPRCMSEVSSILKKYAQGFRGNCTKESELHREKVEYFNVLERLFQEISEENLSSLLKKRLSLPLLFEIPLHSYVALNEEENRFFHALLHTVWPLLHALTDPEAIRKRIAAEAAQVFFAYTTKAKKKTFETLLRNVLLLTNNERFCQKIAEHFSFIIVDEFQDTDTTQLAIFSRLFLQAQVGDRHNPEKHSINAWKGHLLFVGDPKQAIYAFRRADVYSYMRAREFLHEHVRSLTVNYRASPHMVEALNALFTGPEHSFIFYLPRAETHLSILPSQTISRVEPLPLTRGALHFIVAEGAQGRKRNWPHEAIEEQVLSWIAEEIVRLGNEGVLLKQQAVLVKDRYQAQRVEAFFLKKNLPVCSWRLDLVTGSPAYLWLKKVFSLLIKPSQKTKLSSLLFSMQAEEDSCKAIVNDLNRFALAVVAWEKVRKAFISGGIGGLSRELFACHYNGRDVLFSYLERQGKEFSLDLEQILEALAALEKKLPRDIGAMKEALENIEEYFPEREPLLRRVDPDDPGIPILTMHRSKGLEFDVVYALGSSSRSPQSQGDLEEIDAEKLRQMYVSLTRAKKRVYLPVFLEQEGKKVPRGQASPAELLLSCLHVGKKSSLEMWADSLYQAMVSEAQKGVISSLIEAHPAIMTSSLVSEQQSALVFEKKEELGTKGELSAHTLSGSWKKTTSFSQQKRKQGPSLHFSSSQGGALLGTQFHDAIASLLFESESIQQSSVAIADRYDDPKLASLLFSALHVTLPCCSGTFSLYEVPRENMRSEVPFLFSEQDTTVSGVIDLLFAYEGKIYIIDWKTQEVNLPLEEYVKNEGYELQSSLYKKAAIHAFPHVPWGGFFFVFVSHLVSGKEAVAFLN